MLYTIEQTTIFETDAAIQAETQARCDQHAFDKQLARKDPSHRALHRKLRGAPTDQVTDQLACGVHQAGSSYVFYLPDPGQYDLTSTVEYGKCIFKPRSRDAYAIYADSLDDLEPADLPEQAGLKQQRILMQAQGIAECLHNHWDQYWMRDPENETEASQSWQTFREFLNLASDLPTVSSNGTTLDEWIQVQKGTKITAARGADSWSGPEIQLLPRDAVADLKTLLETMHQWPSDLLLARTIPLPKKESPTVRDVRPITVLPMLYRWWARVITKHMLRRLAKVIDQDVTGMLAGRGRGAAASSYVTQAWIERSRHEGRPSGGFTLDFIKCYNQVPRPVATILLKRVGMPPEWVEKWSQALKDMRRLWQISNSLSSPRHSTTGIPEDCPISCIAMVALSSLWCKLLRRHNTVPSAYADNWAWKSDDATRHRPAMATTVEFTKSVRLPISFEKSTWWATGREHEQEWQALLRETLPEEQISRVKRVLDLGNPLTFQGFVSSASIDDRFQKAAVKCTRLQRSDEPPDTKAAILLRNIWPTAMYGSPLVMVPEGKLSSLRTKAADAVFGGPNAGNSAITLAFAGNNIADPELYYFTEVFREARRYLLAADSDGRASFYAIVVASRGKAGKVWGPAGILAQVLIRLTWTCNREGVIGIGAFETLRLELESFEVVKAHRRRAWEGDLLSRFSVNPTFRNALPVDTLATWAALQAFEPGEKALLIRDITGAFLTQDRKAKWAHDATPTCEYCPEPDSISHRLLHCQAFSECRQPFDNVVADLLQKDATDLVLPVIHRDPGQDFLRVTHISHRELEIDPHTQAVADSLQSIPHWYVDGTCAHLESPACYSTCAAILDTLTSDEERQRAVDGLRSMQDLPDTFLVGGFATHLQSGNARGRSPS